MALIDAFNDPVELARMRPWFLGEFHVESLQSSLYQIPLDVYETSEMGWCWCLVGFHHDQGSIDLQETRLTIKAERAIP